MRIAQNVLPTTLGKNDYCDKDAFWLATCKLHTDQFSRCHTRMLQPIICGNLQDPGGQKLLVVTHRPLRGVSTRESCITIIKHFR